MKAVIVSANDAVLKDVPIPEPGDDEILVKSQQKKHYSVPVYQAAFRRELTPSTRLPPDWAVAGNPKDWKVPDGEMVAFLRRELLRSDHMRLRRLVWMQLIPTMPTSKATTSQERSPRSART
jgi:hypothetical protein